MNRDTTSRLVRAGVLTGVIDGLFSSVLSTVLYGSTVTRLFQGVAAALLGKEAFDGGTSTALIGVLMHFGVAFTWSAVFLVVFMRWRWIRDVGLPIVASIGRGSRNPEPSESEVNAGALGG